MSFSPGSPLCGMVGEGVVPDLVLQRLRQARVVEDQVVEAERQVDLDGAGAGNLRAGSRQRRGAVLDRAAHAELLAADVRDRLQKRVIDSHGRERAVGLHLAAMIGAGVDADLADGGEVLAPGAQSLRIDRHELAQFFRRGVLVPTSPISAP